MFSAANVSFVFNSSNETIVHDLLEGCIYVFVSFRDVERQVVLDEDCESMISFERVHGVFGVVLISDSDSGSCRCHVVQIESEAVIAGPE